MALLGVVRVQLARRSGVTGERAAVGDRRDRRGRHRRGRRDRAVGAQRRRRRRHDALHDRRSRRRHRAAVPRCGAPTRRRSSCAPLDAGAVGDGRAVHRRHRRAPGDEPRPVGRRGDQRRPGRSMPFGQMLADMRTTDVHPPLHHAVLWVTVRLFGTSEVAVRLPSLLAGVALVPVMFWVGRTLYDRRTGLDRGDPRGDRPVLRVVLAGSAHVLAVHAVRGRRHRGPGARPPARPLVRLGPLRACRRRCCSGPSTSASCRSSSSRPRSAGRSGRPAREPRRRWRALARGLARCRRCASIVVLILPMRADPPGPARRVRQPRRRARPEPGRRRQLGHRRHDLDLRRRRQPDLGVPRLPRRRADGPDRRPVAAADAARVRDARPRPVRSQPPAARSRRRPDGHAVRHRVAAQRPVRAALLLRCRAGDAAARGARRHGDDRAPGGRRRRRRAS